MIRSFIKALGYEVIKSKRSPNFESHLKNILEQGQFDVVLDVGANVATLLALQALMLSLAGVLMSLYPAATVVLAIVVLRERVTRWQVLGMVMALVAVAIISLHDHI